MLSEENVDAAGVVDGDGAEAEEEEEEVVEVEEKEEDEEEEEEEEEEVENERGGTKRLPPAMICWRRDSLLPSAAVNGKFRHPNSSLRRFLSGLLLL